MPYTIAGDDQANADSKVEEFVKNKTFDTLPISLKETNHFGYVKTTNTDDIKRAIMQHGAVFVSYHDILDDFNADKTAFYSTKYDATRRHAVLLVGWNDDYETSNFKTSPSKKGAWLVRNSRGTTWGGEDGYFWMSYAQADVDSGMEDARAFIISEDVVTNNTIIQNEHDENGKTKNITSKWSAGIFKAERNEQRGAKHKGDQHDQTHAAGFAAGELPVHGVGTSLILGEKRQVDPQQQRGQGKRQKRVRRPKVRLPEKRGEKGIQHKQPFQQVMIIVVL